MRPKSEARTPSQTSLRKEIEPTRTLSNSKCRPCLSMRGKNNRDGMNLMIIRMKERRADKQTSCWNQSCSKEGRRNRHGSSVIQDQEEQDHELLSEVAQRSVMAQFKVLCWARMRQLTSIDESWVSVKWIHNHQNIVSGCRMEKQTHSRTAQWAPDRADQGRWPATRARRAMPVAPETPLAIDQILTNRWELEIPKSQHIQTHKPGITNRTI